MIIVMNDEMIEEFCISIILNSSILSGFPDR